MATSQSNKYQGETPENMAEIPASSRNDFGAHHVVDVDSASPNSPRQQRAEHLRFKFTRTPQPFRFILDNGFSFLCLLAYGEKSLHQIWELAHKPERPGEDWTKPLYDRLNTVCILAGLILSTTATFISATPPVPSMFDFNAPGVYGCLLCSYALLLGGLAVGTVTLFVCLKCDQRWFRRMHLSSPSRIVCITIILAYPFLSTLFAIILGAMALFVGVFLRASTLFRVISCLCAIGPFTILALFGWMQLPSQSTLYMDPGDMADSTEKTNAEGNTTLYSLGERTRANA